MAAKAALNTMKHSGSLVAPASTATAIAATTTVTSVSAIVVTSMVVAVRRVVTASHQYRCT